MKLYHASNVIVEKPDIFHSRSNLDFGPGFYVTALEQQALNYSERFKVAEGGAFINIYEYDSKASERFNVLEFNVYSEEWLKFVTSCRRGIDKSNWDIVVGGVANDKVFKTVEFYMAGDYTVEQALSKLIYEKPNHQICFRSQEAIDALLNFKEARKL